MTTRDRDDLMTLGVVVRPHGIRGEMVIAPHAAQGEDLIVEGQATLSGDDGARPITITSVRWHKGRALVSAEEISDRDAAEELRGYHLRVPRENLPGLPENTYYEDDLHGCRVLDERGEILGAVDGVLRTGAVDVLEIQSPGERWMLPAASEFILEIDIEAREMHVRVPEGLRDT